MNIEEIYEFNLSLCSVEASFPFGEDYLVFKVLGKVFCIVMLEKHPLSISLKCRPEISEYLRQEYSPHIIEGYHLNKKHWNTLLVEYLPSDLIKKQMIHSYEEVLLKLPSKIRKELKYEFIFPFSDFID